MGQDLLSSLLLSERKSSLRRGEINSKFMEGKHCLKIQEKICPNFLNFLLTFTFWLLKILRLKENSSPPDYLVEGDDDTFSLANLKQEISLYHSWLIIILFTSKSFRDMC